MSNTFFQFKQFKINQDKTAMKVGTDGVLLGAWTDCHAATKVLDIGTGTGLIALMIAQRSKAFIDAIEIDINAWFQARSNFDKSPWAYRLKIENVSFQSYCDKGLVKQYELIVCNPPFFINSFKPEQNERLVARHTDILSREELVNGANQLLRDSGKFAIIIPAQEKDEFIQLALQNNLFCERLTYVQSLPDKPAHRVLMEFVKKNTNCLTNTISIEENERHQYSKEYKELTKDYYLNF